MKLRVYLGSPHKFDEAVEFGFPAMDLVPDQDSRKHARRNSDADSPKLHTFLEDDASSLYSETSAGEPESPRTPETSEHPLPMRPIRVSQERGPRVKGDYAQAPACSREMTLRMTLTRPDLRSHEGEMYGWQKKALGRKSSELLSPVMYNTKESIERQFAAIDEEELANGSGVVKRFWNRVRRT
ncbi:hypothetical protein HIM_09181 [Hirsutella minnesotensis 3608]|nr:hypothetical protein HIM_09181 [Hirsutella minnesotensis 3608]